MNFSIFTCIVESSPTVVRPGFVTEKQFFQGVTTVFENIEARSQDETW